MKGVCPNCGEKIIIEDLKENSVECCNCHKKLDRKQLGKLVILNEKAKNGQYKCDNCGSTEILFNEENGYLECKYCKSKIVKEINESNKISSLKELNIGLMARKVNYDKELLTLKCESCGANITINAKEKTYARCGWCHSILTLNNVVENGMIPDKILPFKITKKEALEIMTKEIKGHNESTDFSILANKNYLNNLKLENIEGMYIPYMSVDVNSHVKLEGIGKKVNTNNSIDKYFIKREFNMNIDDLIIEASKDKYDLNSENKANNIINAIQPFDLKDSVEFTSNYLIDYYAEKRDLNYEELKEEASKKVNEIAKQGLKKDRQTYKKGIEWNNTEVDIKGSKWLSVYVPIWLYSFWEEDKNVLHYIAVNGRTGKSMASIPVDKDEVKKQSNILLIGFIAIFSPLLYITFLLFLPNFLLAILLIIVELEAMVILIKKLNQIGYKKNFRKVNVKYDYEKNTNKAYFEIEKEDKKL